MLTFSYSPLMPPICFLLALPVGAVISVYWRRAGIAIVMLCSALVYAFSTPYASRTLLLASEQQLPPPSSEALASAQAIVVLEGDIEYGGSGPSSDDVGPLTLERLRLAARLYRSHPLPILVSGGPEGHREEPGAAIMARVLAQDYGIEPRWIETRAENTFQNGSYSAQILLEHHVSQAIIVTQSWDMPRAVWSFEHAGIAAVPAPARRLSFGRAEWWDFMPNYSSFGRSFFALHELLGLLYYKHHYGPLATQITVAPSSTSSPREGD